MCDVELYIEFGLVADWEGAHVFAWFDVGVEQCLQFGLLLFGLPLVEAVVVVEDVFFGVCLFFVVMGAVY